MEIRIERINFRPDINTISLIVPQGVCGLLEQSLCEKGISTPFDIETRLKRRSRSLTANSYMWVLADKIAGVIHATKEEVYRKAIREVGIWEDVPIKEEAAEYMAKAWEAHGIGWFSEKIRDSKMQGYTVMRLYYGSSIYDQKELSRVIDYIVDDCKELGIETMPENEIKRLMSAWGGERV